MAGDASTGVQPGRATQEVSAGGVASEVRRLIAAGKGKQAVELAKTEHKRAPTPESERLLVDAYLARINQFQQKGAAEDAQVLINLVRGRFPRYQGELAGLEARGAAVSGRFEELVAPLAAANVSPETRESIEAAIRRELVDLRGLANTARLAPDHPLRVAAGAAWRAFEAVTTGPVRDDQIELTEISRRSPLAAWKLVIRAIAAFYGGDDAGCRRALDAIPEDAAVRRLVPVLTRMLDGSPPGPGLAGALQGRIVSSERALPEALEQLERAFQYNDLAHLKRSIRAALQACAADPQQCERLRQHISARCMIEDVPVEHVREATGSTLKNAYFWRLLAGAMDYEQDYLAAAVYWDRFVRHAAHEGWFAADSLEAAVVYQHAAEFLSIVPRRRLEERCRRAPWFELLSDYYRGQPPDIAALAPSSDQVAKMPLDPNYLFDRAARIHPTAELFKKWWGWATAWNLNKSGKQYVLEQWRQKLPRDPAPLLYLSELAESRRAFQLALKHLSEAEAIDPINPQVRKARVRLTLSITRKHFADRNVRLVSQDLAQLEAMPVLGEGDRAAFLLMLRAAAEALRQNWDGAREAADAVAQRIGLLAARVMAESLAVSVRLPATPKWPTIPKTKPASGREAAEAVARLTLLAENLGFEMSRPRDWDKSINKFLKSTKDALPPASLLALGRAALAARSEPQAYLVSAAGLRTATGTAAARFLLLRARSLTQFWQRRRAVQCLRAALNLAQQANDSELMDQIIYEMDRYSAGPLGIGGRGAGRGLDDEALADILKHERQATAYPDTAYKADVHAVYLPGEAPFNPFDIFADDEEDEDEDDFEDDEGGPFDSRIPVQALPLLAEVLKKYGRLPSPEEMARDNPDLARRLAVALGDLVSGDELDSLLDLIGRAEARGRGGRKKRR